MIQVGGFYINQEIKRGTLKVHEFNSINFGSPMLDKSQYSHDEIHSYLHVSSTKTILVSDRTRSLKIMRREDIPASKCSCCSPAARPGVNVNYTFYIIFNTMTNILHLEGSLSA
jgi:hypothetical protein